MEVPRERNASELRAWGRALQFDGPFGMGAEAEGGRREEVPWT